MILISIKAHKLVIVISLSYVLLYDNNIWKEFILILIIFYTIFFIKLWNYFIKKDALKVY